MTAKPVLARGFSLYLDGMRFAAALLVVLDHFSNYQFSSDQAGPTLFHLLLSGRGAQAVAVFFVLSGFVIAFVVETRERSLRQYAASRLSRLYSVVLPALLLTFLLDAGGALLKPFFYEATTLDGGPATLPGYAASLLLAGEWKLFGPAAFIPGSNSPWWSLSFEGTYYLLAGLLLFAPRRWSVPATILILLLAGPTIAALFPLWLLGFALYHLRHRAPRGVAAGFLLLGSSAALLLIPFVFLIVPDPLPSGFFPWGPSAQDRNLVADGLSGVAFAIQLLAVHALVACEATQPEAITGEALIRRLGSMTFPLYAVHFPALFFLAAVSPFPRSSWSSWLFILNGVLILAALLTMIADPLRNRMRQWLLHMRPVSWRFPLRRASAAGHAP